MVYTGEISPSMLTDLGVKYVILGHLKEESILIKQMKI